MGSPLIISMALSGFGWNCIAVCSKRGPLAGPGRGLWEVVHVDGWFGDCGSGDASDASGLLSTGTDFDAPDTDAYDALRDCRTRGASRFSIGKILERGTGRTLN